LTEVRVRANESFERALRRFKRMVEKEGTLRQLREHKEYEKPSDKRRKKRGKEKAGGAKRY